MKIGKTNIGEGCPSLIVGELSGNHRGKYEIAQDSIIAMKKAGIDAAKIQTLKPENITLDSENPDFVIQGGTLWDGTKLFDLYTEIETPFEWVKPLMDLSESLGMEFFSSPFGHEEVEFLYSLNVSAYKIASFEITDIPLIEHAASKGKPIIMSTGIAEKEDIQLAVDACRRMGNNDIVLLKCTSSYPTPPEEANLSMIQAFKRDFQTEVGLSDHTRGTMAPVIAASLGACLIEKHFILNKNLGGPDSEFSLDPLEWATLVNEVRLAEKYCGIVDYNLSEKSKKSRNLCRSLYVSSDVKKGDIISDLNVKSVRPGFGLAPKYWPTYNGKIFTADYKKGDRFSPDMTE